MVPFDTPLLLIIWRRPHTLREVIDALRPVAPLRIFVACDGPHPDRPDEVEKVAATRKVIDIEINWPCKIEYLYSTVNQGCRLGVRRAITWFFERVEEGIILEDDCIPHPDFFPFCSDLLERYRHDTRVWSICGSNFQLGNRRGTASYYFSIHGDSWGWATWRRAWQNYYLSEAEWPCFRDSSRINDVFREPLERDYWLQILESLFERGVPNTWDYQWWLASWMNNALHIWPNANLVCNIGFDSEGTHTFAGSLSQFSSLELEGIGAPLSHPKFILPNREADDFAFWHRRGGLDVLSAAIQAREKKFYGWTYPLILRFRRLRAKAFCSNISRCISSRFSRLPRL